MAGRDPLTENKSIFSQDARIAYCVQNSAREHPAQTQLTVRFLRRESGPWTAAALQKATMERMGRAAIMLGAPEALNICQLLLRLTKAKRCLDVGTFTGASALAWALAIPPDGEVVALDLDRRPFDEIGAPIIEKAGVLNKIKLRIAPAVQTLDALVAEGQSGRFDFAFIDAHKPEYPVYYERCLTLLRPGGIIAIDNALMGGCVYRDPAEIPDSDPWKTEAKYLISLNAKIRDDPRVDNHLLAMADGLHLVVKK